MASHDARGRRVSGRQLDILWEYLNSHRDIAVAFNRSLQAKEYSKQKWRELAEILNSQGDGAHKDWKGWCKYWVDYKAKLKKRAADVRKSRSRTGGGPVSVLPLSEVENKFLQILGEDYGQGLQGVRVEPFPEPSTDESPSILQPPINRLHVSPVRTPPLSFALRTSPAAPLQSPRRSPRLRPRDPAPSLSPPLPPPPALTPALAESPEPTSPPRHRRRHMEEPASAEPLPTAAAPAAPFASQRRRRRGEPAMSQEAARRALVQSSQKQAEAALNNAKSFETIAQCAIEAIAIRLSTNAKTINASSSRAVEREHLLPPSPAAEPHWRCAIAPCPPPRRRCIRSAFGLLTSPLRHLIAAQECLSCCKCYVGLHKHSQQNLPPLVNNATLCVQVSNEIAPLKAQ